MFYVRQQELELTVYAVKPVILGEPMVHLPENNHCFALINFGPERILFSRNSTASAGF